jgi:hypothetical protein
MYKMKDIISFDVKLTPNQKLAQDKLNQVHQLYDEIEKLLGTQGVFKRPHLFMALPKKEPRTNFERITQNEKTLAEFIYCLTEVFDYYAGNGVAKISKYANEDANDKNHIELIHGNRDFDELVEWLKKPNEVDDEMES